VSRIGRMPIVIPEGVQVQIDDGAVIVRGPKGQLVQRVHPDMRVVLEDNLLRVQRPSDSRQHKALHGLTRALLANAVTGVTQGFRKRLVIEGVGYRAEQDGASIVLQVGYSHPVRIDPPEGIKLTVERGGRSLVVEGIDKAVVGEVAAKIRAVRKPEPYKGKGIAYDDEVIRRKPGKAGRAA